MGFSERVKVIAAAIVHIFETSKPLGNYAAYVVLDDGAGVSYGINQFTHRSGSLYAVVGRYLEKGGRAGRAVFIEMLPILSQKSVRAINALAANTKFKNALKAAAATPEMRAAQHEVAFGKYMEPAIKACDGSNFALPLAFAVIYDSINHGSYEKIRDKVSVKRSQFMSDAVFEKAWITEYVQRRDAWLESVPRLKKTDYRTDFFLVQIGRNNWNLDLPMNVHGFKLTNRILDELGDPPATTGGTDRAAYDTQDLTAETGENHSDNTASDLPDMTSESANLPNSSTDTPPADSQPSNTTAGEKGRQGEGEQEGYNFSLAGYAGKAEAAVATASEKFDRVNGVAGAITQRKDSAKSLWTTILGTLWQLKLAIGAFLLGVPREIWIVVAVLTGALILLYLYRQVSLGKIRENAKDALQGIAEII